MASSVAARLVPSGAFTFTSNSASSTLPGMNSHLTKGRIAKEESATPAARRATERRCAMLQRRSRA
jgi:hypothetical protein